MKASRIRRNKIGNHPIIRQATEGIETAGVKEIAELRSVVEKFKAKGRHSKEGKRILRRATKEGLEDILKDIGASLQDLGKMTGLAPKEIEEFFADFFIEIAFRKQKAVFSGLSFLLLTLPFPPPAGTARE